MLLWYWILLTIERRRERYLQTLAALFGLEVVLALPTMVLESLSGRFGQDAIWQIPVKCGASLHLLIWTLLAVGHILRATLERTLRVLPDTGVHPDIGRGNAVDRHLARAALARMHVHILGICGTFMGGIAALARAAGHRVTGSDRNVYPPMSTQLSALGIELIEGYGVEQLELQAGRGGDRQCHVARHAGDRSRARSRPCLTPRAPSGSPSAVLRERWVLAVAGTHGKTTTSSMLAWILEDAGLAPGFLIGGIPENFGHSARLGAAPFFVIEADEYDTAFFDKRAKFVHYRPRTWCSTTSSTITRTSIPTWPSIERQFQHLLRTVPGGGRIVCNGADAGSGARAGSRLLDTGRTLRGQRSRASRRAAAMERRRAAGRATSRASRCCSKAAVTAKSDWSADRRAQRRQRAGGARGRATRRRADRARHPGAEPLSGASRGACSCAGEAAGVRVYDDFAHHPTAIADHYRRTAPPRRPRAHHRGARAALADHAPGRAPADARRVAGGCR